MSPIIMVNELMKQYEKAKGPSVKSMSFHVGEGEFFASFGPSGMGKTTAISILTTTLSKTSGSVTIARYNVEKDAQYVRDKMGIIFQQPNLDFQLSTEENIRFHACLYSMYGYWPTFKMMPAEHRSRVMELTEIVGVEHVLFQPIKKLSDGMQRKLEIIRSLVYTPEILFLDEPTQGLNIVNRHSLWEYIDNVRKQSDTAVFLTTHYTDKAESADKVCTINHREIAVTSSSDEMKSNLLKQKLVVDTQDKDGSIREITNMGLSYHVDDHIIVPYQNRTAQNIIARLETRPTVLKIQEPSLEDTYVEYLMRTGGRTA